MMIKLKIYSAISVLVLIASCKPQGADTELSSLDNLAAESGSYTLNNCTGSSIAVRQNFNLQSNHLVFDNSISSSQKSALKADVQSVLNIVPKDMVAGFFSKGRKIYLSSESPSVCQSLNTGDAIKQAGKEQSDGEPFSCWFVDPKSNASGVAIGSGTINGQAITASQAIKHSLLRSIVSFFSFVVLPSADSALGQASAQTQKLRQFDQAKEALAESLLNDAVQNGISDMGFLQDMSNSSKATLGHYALIESLDSALCSQKTLNVFQACFPNSYATFSSMSSSALPVDPDKCQLARR